MVMYDVREAWSDQRADRDSEQIRLTRIFTVLVDDPDATALHVSTARGVPNVGQRHPMDHRIRVNRIEAEPLGPRYWQVRVFYAAPEDPVDPETGKTRKGGAINPLDAPPQITWGSASATEPVDVAYDKDNKLNVPIVNSAGQPIDPPLQRKFTDRTLQIVRNEKTFDRRRADDYFDVVNADRFFGADPQTVLCEGLTGTFVVEAQYAYWQVTYAFKFRIRDSWLRRVLNVGTQELIGDARYNIVDPEGQPISVPAMLKPNGRVVNYNERYKDGTTGVTTNTQVEWEAGRGGTIWLKFRMYPSLPFAPLDLE
jgi:hypothetical protein